MVPFVIILFMNAHLYPVEKKSTESYIKLIEGEEESANKMKRTISRDSLVDDNLQSTERQYVSVPATLNLWQELIIIVKRPIFLCVTAGYAAQSASLVGLSTFGSAFIISLGFFDTETEASSVFGVVVSMAGLVGTPLGGYLVDIVDRLYKHRLVQHVGKEATSPAKSPVRAAAAIITISSMLGMFVMLLTYLVQDKWLYLFVLVVGCTALFATTTGINIIIMMAVPERNRSFAIAISSIAMHVLGDVPSPIFAGLLKDTLAPQCSGSGEDDAISAGEDCRSQSDGIRLTMLLIVLWLGWSVFFNALVWRFTTTYTHTLDHLDREAAEKRIRGDSEGDMNEQLITSH